MNRKHCFKLYSEMLYIRLVEEMIAKKYHEQKMRCPVHLSIGQEATAVGVCQALLKKDRIFAGKTAAAKGLFFLGPRYNSEDNISSPVSNLFDRLSI